VYGGRRRLAAEPRDGFIEARIAEIEGERHLAFRAALFNRRGKSAEQAYPPPPAEHDAVAGLQPLGGTGQSRPAVRIEAARERHRDVRRGAVALARAFNLGRDDL